MPVGFARSLFGSVSVFIPKETVITIGGISSQNTGLFYSTSFSTSKDELGIVGSTVGGTNGRALIIADGTYNMQITGGGTSISTSLSGSGISGSVTLGKGNFSFDSGTSGVAGSFNVSKNYSGTRSGTTGAVPLDDVVLPYDFGTVTFSNNKITMRSGINTGSGNSMGTPSFTITLYEIAS
jgi:hypothetical protein